MNSRNNSYSSSRAPPPAPLYFVPSRSSTMSSNSTHTQLAESYDMPAYDYTTSTNTFYRTDSAGSVKSTSGTGVASGARSSSVSSSLSGDDARSDVFRTTSSSTYASSYASSSSSSSSPSFQSSSPRSYAGSHYAASTGSSAKKNNVNVYTTCGRHSNEWLFSGWSSPFRRRDGN